MPRLTNREKDAVCRVLDEFLAGHDAALVRDAGLAETEKEAGRLLKALSRARFKLTPRGAAGEEQEGCEVWWDGVGHDHACTENAGHKGKHICRCGATTEVDRG